MRVLYFGDIFGRPGREAVLKALPRILEKYPSDFIIGNVENIAHGRGVTPQLADEMLGSGFDCLTTGNHAWDQASIIPVMDSNERILRPANYPECELASTPGRGLSLFTPRRNKSGAPLAVAQFMERVFMDSIDCPFQKADELIQNLKRSGVKCIFVDFHGEATSEKQAMAHFLDGRVSAVVGSHAHVQTADERILPGGTAAITDVGMCGCFDSVIGIKKELSIQKFISKRPVKYEPADGPGGYGAVVVEIDEKTGKATNIVRLREAVVH